MKRLLRNTFFLFVLFICTDKALSILMALLYSAPIANFGSSDWNFSTFACAYLLLTTIVFLAAGAILTCFVDQRRLTWVLAFGFGLANPAIRLFFEHIHPWFWKDHGVTLLFLIITWANWWLPTLGVCLGAIMTYELRTRLNKTCVNDPIHHSLEP